VAGKDRDRLGLVDRLDRRRAPLVVEHRQFAKDVTGSESREGDRAAVGVLAHRARVSGADDVARAALIALAEYDLAAREPARHRHLGDARKLLVTQRREHRHARKQLDRVPAGGRHPGRWYCWLAMPRAAAYYRC